MPPTATDKFQKRARRCLFIGYPFNQKGYKLYDTENHKIFTSRDVIFKECIYPYKLDHTLGHEKSDQHNSSFLTSDYGYLPLDFFHNPDNSVHGFGSAQNDDGQSSTPNVSNNNNKVINTDSVVEQRIVDFNNTEQPSATHNDIATVHNENVAAENVIQTNNKNASDALIRRSMFDRGYVKSLCNVIEAYEPSYYHQACHDQKWIKAMNVELTALDANHTWDLV
ncbi:uncharacterized protein LOC141620690 [Silene latifolia]|uniref:uncharacterized protein LOC141620690 n=1 Tax=Silene latifolia TaxID=37657 RepID=UPI003D77BAB4